jgi:hypothetical protein
MGSMRTHKKIGIAVGLKDLLIEAEFTLDSILKHGAQVLKGFQMCYL